MSALPRALGAGLDIRQNVQVTRLEPDADGWTVHLGDGTLRAAHVVLTVPAPQVAALLGNDHPLVARLGAVHIAPCLTLMAAVTAPAPFITRKDADDPLSWIALDSAKPGRPQGAGSLWVAQAGAAFSAAYLEDDPATLTARMLPLLCDRLGTDPAHVTHAAAHRWRYARVTQPLGQPFLRSDDGTLVRKLLKQKVEETRMLRRMPDDLKRLFHGLGEDPEEAPDDHPLQPHSEA